MSQADNQQDSVVAIYDTHSGAEAALKALQHAGLDVKRLSIVGKDFHTEEHALGFYTAGDRMKFWGSRAAFWGSLWGMLTGGAFFLIPGIGPLVAMGPLAGLLAGALEGAAVGGAAGVLAAALASAGFPKESVIKYELEVKAGNFLVMAHGTREMIVHAHVILGTTGALQLEQHLRELTARTAILGLLSDEEVAKVSNAEAAAGLASGDEYLDLEQLDQGVRRALGAPTATGSVLPRKAVHAATWGRILAQLAAPRGAAPRS